MMPGKGVTTDFARAWGCNSIQMKLNIHDAKTELPDEYRYTPQVGWDVCELMAKVGVPDDIRRQSGYGVTSATWWYGTGAYEDLTMISLRKNELNKWVVTYISR